MREELLLSVILGPSLAQATQNNENDRNQTQNDFKARYYFFEEDYRVCLYDKHNTLCCTEDHDQVVTWGWREGLSLDQTPDYLGSTDC